MGRSAKRWLALVGIIVALVVTATPARGTGAGTVGVAPHAIGMMDCNGDSKVYKSVKIDLGGLCTDPISIWSDGSAWQFFDNGRYVGHDEPSIKFISSAMGSGSSMTYFMRLAVDPKAPPSAVSTAVTDYAELSPAPWFGLALCDPNSYPQNPCTPDSDSNQGMDHPHDAGSAFMELQFYPPGYPPFVDGPSCDATHYCAALTIDSLECSFGFNTCNNSCVEPVNFAFLQTDGVPAGPVSPQLSDYTSFTPNGKTLLMNQGDMLSVTVTDTANGLYTGVDDLTSRQSGFMVASAGNGFMNTSIADCSGTPFSFHAEYNTARQQNQVPWAALEGGVLMEDEIGHFEPCSAVTYPFPITDGAFSDPSVYQTCLGGFDKGFVGEGPCNLSTGQCTGSTTEGGAACPSSSFFDGALCEYSDAACMPAGPRTITVNSQTEVVSWPVAGCQDNYFQNGDLDFDGTPYYPDWPDGTPGHPTSFSYMGPFDAHGSPYPLIQFETDAAGSEYACNTQNGSGCVVPPTGAHFYPFWTLGRAFSQELPDLAGEPLLNLVRRSQTCAWNFGNTIVGGTLRNFGGAAEYGKPNTARYGGTIISVPMHNPQLGNCATQ